MPFQAAEQHPEGHKRREVQQNEGPSDRLAFLFRSFSFGQVKKKSSKKRLNHKHLLIIERSTFKG